MAGFGYTHIILSESLHILLNREEQVDNELLENGLLFIVEEGIENARSVEEI